MKTANIGFECDTLQNASGQLTIPVTQQIILDGYQMNLSLAFLEKELIAPFPIPKSPAPYSMVLFLMGWSTTIPTAMGINVGPAEFGNPVTSQIGGTNPAAAHTGGISSQIFCNAIIKSFNQSAENKTITVRNLGIMIPAGSYIVLQAANAGFTCDFEAQGVLFYS